MKDLRSELTTERFDIDEYADSLIDAMLRNTSVTNIHSQQSSDQIIRAKITYYLMGIAGTLLCIFGIIGNLMSLIVLTRKPMRLSSTYTYLSAIAICDSLVLSFTIILLLKDIDEGGFALNNKCNADNLWTYHQNLYPHLFPYVHPLACTFQVTSIWLTLAFTVDRYIMICHPLHASPYCTINRARFVVSIVTLLGIVYNIPKFFEYQSVNIIYPNGRRGVKYDVTSFGRSSLFREVYHSTLYIIFVCFVPLTALAVMNTALMRAVQTSRAQGKKRLRLQERKRNDTTIMLIGVVVIFFMCQTPAVASHVIWAFYSDIYLQKLPIYLLNEISNFLVTLNSAINIVPYYFFGRRFRMEFCQLFCISKVCLSKSDIENTADGYKDRRRSSQYSGYSTTANCKFSTKLNTKVNNKQSFKLTPQINEHLDNELSIIDDNLLLIYEPTSVATEPITSQITKTIQSSHSL